MPIKKIIFIFGNTFMCDELYWLLVRYFAQNMAIPAVKTAANHHTLILYAELAILFSSNTACFFDKTTLFADTRAVGEKVVR